MAQPEDFRDVKEGRKALMASLLGFASACIASLLFVGVFALVLPVNPGIYKPFIVLKRFADLLPEFLFIVGIIYGYSSRQTRVGQWGMVLGIVGLIGVCLWRLWGVSLTL